MSEIKVSVVSYGPKRPLMLLYTDPISGKRKTKSAGTTDEREAERAAGEWEKELREGRYVSPSKITWSQFRKKYIDEKGPKLSPKTILAFGSAANHLERVLDPDRLCKLTAPVISHFTAKLRAEGMGEVSIGCTLRHLRAALSWGVKMKLLPAVPELEIPRPGGARCRAVTTEELERMLAVVPQVRPEDSATWIFYLKGLFYGGLRLGESLTLSWDDDALFAVDLTGRRPAFRIAAEAQKSRRDERLPMTEDFYRLIMETPEAERVGKVFKLNGLLTGTPITDKRVSKIVRNIGRRARVVVGTVDRRSRDKVTSKVTTTQVKKFASAHDLRRGFITKWSRIVSPSVLMKLARHQDISTTQKYYVVADCDEIGDLLWERGGAENGAKNGAEYNTFHNKRPKPAISAEGAPDATTSETPTEKTTYVSGGHGTRTHNRQAGT